MPCSSVISISTKHNECYDFVWRGKIHKMRWFQHIHHVFETMICILCSIYIAIICILMHVSLHFHFINIKWNFGVEIVYTKNILLDSSVRCVYWKFFLGMREHFLLELCCNWILATRLIVLSREMCAKPEKCMKAAVLVAQLVFSVCFPGIYVHK